MHWPSRIRSTLLDFEDGQFSYRSAFRPAESVTVLRSIPFRVVVGQVANVSGCVLPWQLIYTKGLQHSPSDECVFVGILEETSPQENRFF